MLGKSNLIGAEIGVWEGSNADGMFKSLGSELKKLFLVDSYEPYIDGTQDGKCEPLQRDFSGSEKTAHSVLRDKPVVWLKKKSIEAAKEIEDNSLDFVYIDAAHQKSNVLEDIAVWLPKVKKGGLIGGHDINISDVKEAVMEKFADKWEQWSDDWFYINA